MNGPAAVSPRPPIVWAIIVLKAFGLVFGLWGYITVFSSPPASEFRTYANDLTLIDIVVTVTLFTLSLLEIVALLRLWSVAVPLLALEFFIVAIESISTALFGPPDPAPDFIAWGAIVFFSGLNFAIWRYAAHLKKTGVLK